MLSSRVDGIDQETSKEVEWEVHLPQGRRWRLESPVFAFEGLKYRLWVYTDYLQPNQICAQLDMQGPFIASPSQKIQWQVGVKRGNGAGSQWTERCEIFVQGVFSQWRFVDKWKIRELSKHQQQKDVLEPNGRLTLILQLSTRRAVTVSQLTPEMETTDINSSELFRDERRIQHADISNSDDDLTQSGDTLPCLSNALSRSIVQTKHQVENLNNIAQSVHSQKSTSTESDTASLNDSSEWYRSRRKRIRYSDLSSSDEDDLSLPDKLFSRPVNSIPVVIGQTKHQVANLNNSSQPVPAQKSAPVRKEIGNYMPSVKDSDAASLKEFQKIVFQKLDTILHKIKVFENKLETIESNLKTNREKEQWKNESYGIKCDKNYFKLFPLSTDSAVLEIEEELHTKGIDELVDCLRVIGGSNEQECITRILQRVLTNEIAEHYSWSGFKGNKIFKHLYLARAIFCAAKAHYPSLTEKSAEQIIAKWLKYAKQRKQRFEEKSKKLKQD